MITDLRKNTEAASWPARGEWRAWRRQSGGIDVAICCPGCGFEQELHAYTIDLDGMVYPQFVCPTQLCTFFGQLHLEGWPPT